MSATDRLRAMLDDRGVEWRNESCMSDSENITFWNTDADVAVASQGYDGMLWVSARLTPEQAIAATMDAETCSMDVLDTGNEAAYEHYEYIMHCANCHHEFGYVQYNEDGDTWMDDKPRFCPNCGKRATGC